MRRGAFLALTSLLVTRVVAACPCSDDAIGGAGLVRPDERYAAALVATSRRALGRFDAFGHYSPLAAAEGETSEELLLRAGLRLPRRLEWLAELGYASFRFHAPGVVERNTGVGDLLAFARYDLLSESMPHERLVLPALALDGLVRAPLGNVAGTTTGFGSGGAQLGLGAWEAGGGIEASRSILPRLQLLFGLEAAYRFRDHVLQEVRRLGPRADVALSARVLPSDWLSANLGVRARVTDDVTLAGQRLDGTGERLWTLVLGASVFERKSRLRSSVTLSVDPALGRFSQGSTSARALSFSLGYGAN